MMSIEFKSPSLAFSSAASIRISPLPSSGPLGTTKKTAVKRTIIDAISRGMFEEGDKLPSIIRTAKSLCVSRNTVKAAYLDLVDEQVVIVRRREGHFVARRLPTNLLHQGKQPPRLLELDGAAYLESAAARTPCAGTFPVASWRKATWLAISRYSIDCWTGSSDRMEEILVNEIIATVLPRRGIRANPSEVLITTGTRSAYCLIADCLFSPRTRIGMEDPGNPVFREIATRYTENIVALPVGMQGTFSSMSHDAIEYLYCAPVSQCPTTRQMTEPEREELLSGAERSHATIIEDDTESELMHIECFSPSLYACAPSRRVLYVGGFAESLSEGLRMGYLVGPASVIARLRARRSMTSQEPPTNNQSALAHFIHEGFYDSHISSMHVTSRRCVNALKSGFREILPNWQLMIHSAGTKGWISLPSDCASRLLEASHDLGVSLYSGDDYFFSRPTTSNFVRAHLGGLDQERIRDLLLLWRKAELNPKPGKLGRC